MMYHYPFGGFPGFGRKYYYQNPNYFFPNNSMPNYKTQNPSNSCSVNNKKNSNCSDYKKQPKINVDVNCDSENSLYESECFEFFGIKLHSDDLLILLLLFFLYKEGTDDIYLYIALFLLLFS